MKTIPTAEAFMRREYDDNSHINEFAERQIDMKHAIWAMQQFAKLHVEAQREAILLKLQKLGIELTDDVEYEQTLKSSILNAYPLSKIV